MPSSAPFLDPPAIAALARSLALCRPLCSLLFFYLRLCFRSLFQFVSSLDLAVRRPESTALSILVDSAVAFEVCEVSIAVWYDCVRGPAWRGLIGLRIRFLIFGVSKVNSFWVSHFGFVSEGAVTLFVCFGIGEYSRISYL